MTEPVKGHNHDTAADLELDELRAESQRWKRHAEQVEARCMGYRDELAKSNAESQRWRERLGRAEERALQFEKERDEWKAKHAEEWAHVTEYVRLAAEYQVQRDAALKAHKALLADYAGLQAQHFAATQRAEAAERERDIAMRCAAKADAERDGTRARAESAEAKVRELEDHPPGIGDGDIQRVFRERDAAEAALRVAREAMERAERVQTSHLVNGMPGWPPYRVNRDAGEILAEVRNILRAAIAPKEGT